MDIGGNKMYWTIWGPVNKIQHANLEGSNIEDIITDLQSPRGIALDVPNGKMYWADLGAGKIQRANLDGSDIEDIITNLRGQTVLLWTWMEIRFIGQMSSVVRFNVRISMVQISKPSLLDMVNLSVLP